MNSTKQLRALIKFHISSPSIWLVAAALGIPALGSYLLNERAFPLPLYLQVQGENLALIGVFTAFFIAPERFLSSNQSTWTSGTEFLLTRAVDRSILYRSRAMLLYLMVLIFPLISILVALRSPDLIVTELSAKVQPECLSNLPGSTLLSEIYGLPPTRIFIPQGSVLIALWHFWLSLVAIIMFQALLLILSSMRWKRFIFFALLGAFFFGSFQSDSYFDEIGSTTLYERLFFAFIANQALFWVATVCLILPKQLWFERHFARLEF
jgi:hypothetical protein